jgi:hypothetical protein
MKRGTDLELKLGPREHVSRLEHADHRRVDLERALLYHGHLW